MLKKKLLFTIILFLLLVEFSALSHQSVWFRQDGNENVTGSHAPSLRMSASFLPSRSELHNLLLDMSSYGPHIQLMRYNNSPIVTSEFFGITRDLHSFVRIVDTVASLGERYFVNTAPWAVVLKVFGHGSSNLREDALFDGARTLACSTPHDWVLASLPYVEEYASSLTHRDLMARFIDEYVERKVLVVNTMVLNPISVLKTSLISNMSSLIFFMAGRYAF
ncbi:hypothetical protein DL96DRAFT_1564199 [Flagelloscypha sp. PMI_526]|nr:hypothetical protein DL96DRAFT_1564199 [Flagelloscypha sp. PMI_526]